MKQPEPQTATDSEMFDLVDDIETRRQSEVGEARNFNRDDYIPAYTLDAESEAAVEAAIAESRRNGFF